MTPPIFVERISSCWPFATKIGSNPRNLPPKTQNPSGTKNVGWKPSTVFLGHTSTQSGSESFHFPFVSLPGGLAPLATFQGSLYYQPKQCTIVRGIPQNHHWFASSLIPPKMGNLPLNFCGESFGEKKTSSPRLWFLSSLPSWRRHPIDYHWTVHPTVDASFSWEKDVPWFLKKLDPKKRSPKASSKRKGTSQISFEVLQKKRFQIDEISRFTLPLKLL